MALPEDRLREAEERMEAGRIRALIIEDNQDITANLYAFLEPLGYELDCSANGHIGRVGGVPGFTGRTCRSDADSHVDGP